MTFFGSYIKREINILQNEQIKDIITVKNLLPKRKGLEILKNDFDALLFIGVENQKSVISNKLMDYLKLGLPILGICKGNEAEEIIQLTNTGLTCDFDVNSIKNTLSQLINDEYNYSPDHKSIESFNRINQSEEISDIIINNL